MKEIQTDSGRIMRCPDCQMIGHQIKDGHNRSGSQRYKCKACGCTYTPQPNCAGYPDDIRWKAIMLYQSGMSFRAIGRTLGINHQTVANWVNGHFIKSPDDGDGRRG